jgi:hypothetical protein
MHPRLSTGFALLVLAMSAMTLNPLTARAAGPLSATAVSAASPRAVVLQVIRPFYERSAQGNQCNAVGLKLAACPVTARVRHAMARELRWERAHTLGGNGNPFCRCQNTPRQVTISSVRIAGSTAQVVTVWHWGAGNNVRISWVTRRVGGGWLVDDNYCTGEPQKDFYHIPIGPCP